MTLEGLKILDLTRLAPGPFATMLLGDMGADVLKVEDTGAGDYIRTTGEPHVKESYTFLTLNRNKRSVCLNLKTEAGRGILKRLVRKYDVLIEQFRPGVMERLGVGFEALRRENPALIYCALTGYGQTGPMADEPGHDLNYLALSGVLDSIARPGEAPVIPGVYIGDMTAGLWTVIAVLSAVYRRERTGEGEYVDLSIYESVLPLLNMYASAYFETGRAPEKKEKNAGYNIYETADGRYVTVAAAEPKFWARLCTMLGREDFIPRLGDGPEGQAEMRETFAEIFRTKTRDEWTKLLYAQNAMYAPVLYLAEAFSSPQFTARGMEWRMQHPVEGGLRSIGSPVKFRNNPAGVRRCPPLQGEHTTEVLRELGLSGDEIAALLAEGAVRQYEG